MSELPPDVIRELDYIYLAHLIGIKNKAQYK
jgi:hypothetical protein